MNNTTLPACSVQKRSYDILGELSVDVYVQDNPYSIDVDLLFAMAARKNKKRGFLFVSKVLGKHIPVHPLIPFIGGAALATRYSEVLYGSSYEGTKFDIVKALKNPEQLCADWPNLLQERWDLPEATLFIGFAETATALGHAMFARFAGKAKYLHTTREKILNFEDSLEFLEEHSHAPNHICYVQHRETLDNQDRIVLIDDEITTGKSALNFIRTIQSRYPRKSYAVVSLLDWRSTSDRQRFAAVEQELGIEIKTISLLSGSITVKGLPLCNGSEEASEAYNKNAAMAVEKIYLDCIERKLEFISVDSYGKENNSPYLQATGRFGLSVKENLEQEAALMAAGRVLAEKRKGKRTLCLGTGEFTYVPFSIALQMGAGVVVQSTTRSPIFPLDQGEYAVKQALAFSCPSDPGIMNYVYNIPLGYYDEIFIFFERDILPEQLEPMLAAFRSIQVPRVIVVICSCPVGMPYIEPPQTMGSYRPTDVKFLLKELSGLIAETGTQEREEKIQEGGHYSEMLPQEYRPAAAYIALFHQTLRETATKVALAVGIVAERIFKLRGSQVVLTSLARAGTPIGVLIKRYIENKYDLDLPHYSISIIRGKGIDEIAIWYILQRHPQHTLQFIDGWTGKGAITKELIGACKLFSRKYGVELNADMAVLADPGRCVSIYGTREDFLIPSACLNATVSGLVSRTVHRTDLIGQYDFHGAKYYKEWAGEDVSELFIDTIAQQFASIYTEAAVQAEQQSLWQEQPNWAGLEKIKDIQNKFGVADINLIKPGVGETTRVLLRRVPWRILVDSKDNPNLRHIMLLAAERNVPVEEWQGLSYSCCGLIKPVGR